MHLRHVQIHCYALLATLLGLLPGIAAADTEEIYSRSEASVFTVEVHTGNRDTKSSLGSGYLVTADGGIITNHHVVDAYLRDPIRHQLRVKTKGGEYPATVRAFDLINDLALLQAQGVNGKPFRIAATPPAQGAAVVSMGNPHGLHLSIIRGIFNGYAEKGLIDRMLLSMPLNSGMSGGPILNAKEEVIGTNVSIVWLTNSISFGVPAAKIPSLLAGAPLRNDKQSFLAETRRQLESVESSTALRLRDGLLQRDTGDTVKVGDSLLPRLPDFLECWDSSRNFDERGISKAVYSCNLQFTPSLGEDREIASIELMVEHLRSRGSPYGFYGYLTQHGDAHHEPESRESGEVATSAPQCSTERVTAGTLTWKINTCLNAYVDFPKLYNFAMVATSIDRPREAVYLALHMRGFRLQSFAELSRLFLERVRLEGQP